MTTTQQFPRQSILIPPFFPFLLMPWLNGPICLPVLGELLAHWLGPTTELFYLLQYLQNALF